MPRANDDDDDRPRRRRPRDDDDDRPRKRRPRDDEDDDDRPTTRRKSYDEDDDDTARRKRRKKRPVQKQLNVVGVISLVIGGIGLISSFICCIAKYSLVPSGIGLIVGFIGLIVANRSEGRQGSGLPIAGMSVSFLAVLIGIGWLVAGKQIEKYFDREMKEEQARFEKEEESRNKERAKAATEVKAADPNTVIKVTAVQFFQAYAADDTGRRADRTYKNRIVEVTGILHEVNFAHEEGYMVMLRGGPEPENTVDCIFVKDQAMRTKLAGLRPGATITIRGKCLGDDCILHGCILISPE